MASKYQHTTDIHNTKSPSVIIPFLLKYIKATSVIDIGCGTGTWLKVFKSQGVSETIGIDGFHLDKSVLVIPQEDVKLKDLEKPFELEKKFDLAISLEVAEHLAPSSAQDFVSSITKLSDIILFSAAIPGQGGQNHLNEQWPSYWKHLFETQGFEMIDCIRSNFWNNKEVDWWYRQNMFLVIKKDTPNPFPINSSQIIDIVHPEIFTPRSEDYIHITRGSAGIARGLKIFLKNVTRSFRK
jgi:SAM-dependent methyltransferase